MTFNVAENIAAVRLVAALDDADWTLLIADIFLASPSPTGDTTPAVPTVTTPPGPSRVSPHRSPSRADRELETRPGLSQ